jgi:hypothetical protein
MNAYQLDIFEPIPDEIDILRSQIIDLSNMSHSVRKGVFKRISDLENRLLSIEERLNILECGSQIDGWTFSKPTDLLPKSNEVVERYTNISPEK